MIEGGDIVRKGVDCNGVEWVERVLSKNMNDIGGRTFGKLTVLFPVCIGKQTRKAYWLCLCECGNEVVCRADNIINRHTKSCGCLLSDMLGYKHQCIRDAMIGKVFGKLTVVAFDCLKEKSDGCMVASYWCQCECGSSLVSIRGDQLTTGATKSCGCLHAEVMYDKNALDISNVRFGKLVARKPTDKRDSDRSIIWVCDCDCGNIHYASARALRCGSVSSCGCVKSLGELHIKEILDKNNIIYIYNKPYFDDLRNDNGNLLKYDFILIDKNNLPYQIIEFDGIQHDEPVDFFGGQEVFDKQKVHDVIKNQYALSHNIPLVRIPYYKKNNITLEDLLGDQFLIKGEKQLWLKNFLLMYV